MLQDEDLHEIQHFIDEWPDELCRHDVYSLHYLLNILFREYQIARDEVNIGIEAYSDLLRERSDQIDALEVRIQELELKIKKS